MWIFTSNGMISAVKHRDIPDTFMVRARVMAHLEHIFPGEPITQLSAADYKYRVTIGKAELQRIVAAQIEAIEYDNFKNSIADHQYHDACTGVWREMHKLQPGSMYADRQERYPIAGTTSMFDDDPWPDEEPGEACTSCGSERLTVDGDITWCLDCCTPVNS